MATHSDLATIRGNHVVLGTMYSILKKNLNACRPSEHPPVREKMSKRLGGIIGCKYTTSSWHLNGFPMVVILGQQYNIGGKPTVMYPYIDRHAGTSDKNKTKQF